MPRLRSISISAVFLFALAACGGRSVSISDDCALGCGTTEQCVQGVCIPVNQNGPEAGRPPLPPPRTDFGARDFRKMDLGAPPPKDFQQPPPPPDVAVVAPSCPEAIGKPCKNQNDCGGTAKCIGQFGNIVGFSVGVCGCPCTPDDFQTPLINEDTCPTGSLCGPSDETGGFGADYCFEVCEPKLGSNSCDAPLACLPESAGYAAYSMSATAVCALEGCSSNADCPVTTDVTCNAVTGNGCGKSQKCHPVDESGIGRCANAGNCDLASGLCDTHSQGNAKALVGDACQSDLDCGGEMSCQLETFLEGTKFARNGYCTISGCLFSPSLSQRACPAGASCNRLYAPGLCQKSCTVADAQSCRGNANDLYGDYECRDWSTLWVRGAAVSDTPVCGFGPSIPCSILAGSTITCAILGAQGENTTNMECRGLDGVIKNDPYDPNGYCLDETGSGPMP